MGGSEVSTSAVTWSEV